MAPTNSERLDDLAAKVDTIIQQIAILTTAPTSPSPTPPPPPPHPLPPRMKLDVPKFDGTDAMGWIFKINQFFDFHQTLEEDRLTVASFYMEGQALSWYQWMHRNQQITSWYGFLQALETRFAPSYYDDPSSTLFKLTQRSSVNQYLNEFERLANRIVGLPQPFLLSCFISGLTPEIRREVQAIRPASLSQATALAKLQEDKVEDRRRHFKGKNQNPSSLTVIPSTSNLPPLLPAPPTSRVNFRKLSTEEMASRREKGLCYNCDETFTPHHKCKGRFFLLISDEGFDTDLPNDTISPPPELENNPPTIITEPPEQEAQISFHAISGGNDPATIRIQGYISNHPVTVLIDGGSTHNFVQTRLAKFLELPSHPTNTLKVMVGNGSILEGHQLCSAIPITLQKETFTIDFYSLPLCGADVVLGAPWLRSIGPVLMDYTALTLSYKRDNQTITLTGNQTNGPNPISAQQLKRCVQTHGASEMFHIQAINQTATQTQPDSKPHPLPAIQTLLHCFNNIFSEPTHLPPSRPSDHRITLLPNSNPINVRPYRYPYFQKNEIEKQIQNMLASNTIQPSHSSFSSPVLLVKKKDGTWRFCVDYRALNNITIRDRFPMPTIDELLDELNGASWFSKLDLRQGFHQIRMHEEDIPKTAFRTHQGHYEFKVMPFGLCNAPSTFQSSMNKLFSPFLRRFVIVFFDDIMVYSKTFQEHLQHLEQVFNTLVSDNFFLKLSKCLFAQRQLEYLGHMVSPEGVFPEPSKIQAILDWPLPKTVTELRGFLGLTGFYRKFVKSYATIALPLTSLLRKDAFIWTDEATAAFQALQQAMTNTPTLALPDFTQPFVLETDASGLAMGAVLMQN